MHPAWRLFATLRAGLLVKTVVFPECCNPLQQPAGACELGVVIATSCFEDSTTMLHNQDRASGLLLLGEWYSLDCGVLQWSAKPQSTCKRSRHIVVQDLRTACPCSAWLRFAELCNLTRIVRHLGACMHCGTTPVVCCASDSNAQVTSTQSCMYKTRDQHIIALLSTVVALITPQWANPPRSACGICLAWPTGCEHAVCGSGYVGS